jgi:hypothetical protein
MGCDIDFSYTPNGISAIVARVSTEVNNQDRKEPYNAFSRSSLGKTGRFSRVTQPPLADSDGLMPMKYVTMEDTSNMGTVTSLFKKSTNDIEVSFSDTAIRGTIQNGATNTGVQMRPEVDTRDSTFIDSYKVTAHTYGSEDRKFGDTQFTDNTYLQTRYGNYDRSISDAATRNHIVGEVFSKRD